MANRTGLCRDCVLRVSSSKPSGRCVVSGTLSTPLGMQVQGKWSVRDGELSVSNATVSGLSERYAALQWQCCDSVCVTVCNEIIMVVCAAASIQRSGTTAWWRLSKLLSEISCQQFQGLVMFVNPIGVSMVP